MLNSKQYYNITIYQYRNVISRSASDPRKGFTLVEILIVIGVMALMLGVTAPFGVDFYQSRQLDANSRRVVQTLREAQLKAMSGQESSQFGVYIDEDEDKISLFKGSDFATGEVRQDFSVPEGVVFEGREEVVFSRLTGAPENTGEVRLSSSDDSITVSINDEGKIERE